MKIGIDAKWFFEGPPSGKIVVRNLVQQMIALDTEHELYIFLDKKSEGEPFPYPGKRVHPVYVWAGNNLISNLVAVPLAAARLGLDIVVFQNFSPLVSGFKRYSYVHCVLFTSNPEYFTFKERLYFAPMKLTCRRSHGICTVSEAEKSRMIQYDYGTQANIDVIHHGISERFRPKEEHPPEAIEAVRARYGLPERFLLYVGRLNVVKNISNLIKALPFMEDQIPLVIVGDYDWKMTNLDPLVQELGLRDRVRFTGAIYGEDLARVYALATVFCFPSYEESFGLPALEAMASGVPAVVSNRSSLPEICGDAGSYIDPDSPEDIAAQLDLLLREAALYQEKQRLGLERARQFTWELSAAKLMQCLVKVAQGKGR